MDTYKVRTYSIIYVITGETTWFVRISKKSQEPLFFEKIQLEIFRNTQEVGIGLQYVELIEKKRKNIT